MTRGKLIKHRGTLRSEPLSRHKRPSVGDDHGVAMLPCHHAVEPGTQDAETQVTEDSLFSTPFISIHLYSSLLISHLHSQTFEARRLQHCSASVRFEHLGLGSYRILQDLAAAVSFKGLSFQ
jgi:hypothetical protein